MSVHVVISRNWLLKRKACLEGVEFFESMLEGDGDVVEGDWDEFKYLWLSAVYPRFIAWLRTYNMIPAPNFEGLDFSGITLDGAYLRDAIFEGCIFTGCTFVDADVRNTCFSSCVDLDLTGAIVE